MKAIYSPPEKETPKTKRDVYRLGIILFILVTGKSPIKSIQKGKKILLKF
jgi:hypothetical protein